MFLDLVFSKDPDDRILYVLIVTVSIVSIVLHELGHALAATWEGDPTPKIRGHLTLDPRVHMGWLSIGLLCLLGIGWGLTPVTPRNFRHRRWGEAIVSFAGPAVNVLLVLLGVLALVLSQKFGAPERAIDFWGILAWRNMVLFLFNMIPIPPFDGFGVLDGAFDLGEFGARIRTAGLATGWLVASLLVNFGVIPVFEWAQYLTKHLVGVARVLMGGG